MGRKITKAKPINRKQAMARPIFTGRASPKYVLPGDVWTSTLQRMRWIFDEFDGHVSVSNSGGKDSTVVVELALIVARERGELPLKVVWLDQECEYASTWEYQRWMADRPEIDFQWYQVPFKLFNATNHAEPWLHVWGEGEDWVREKEPDSIQVNDLIGYNGKPVDRFKDVLAAINLRTGGAILTGMRCEESPARRLFLTTKPSYKHITWGSEGWDLYWMFHPIYDWSYRDVWKAIHDHAWRYNTMYDTQFQYGIPIKNMRVSNYHHETALSALFYLQEAEPETWEAATRRLSGISTVGHIGKSEWTLMELPYMFVDWTEYMHHLIDNLVPIEEYRETFRKMHSALARSLPDTDPNIVARVIARAVAINDLYGTTVDMFSVNARHPANVETWKRAQTDHAFADDNLQGVRDEPEPEPALAG